MGIFLVYLELTQISIYVKLTVSPLKTTLDISGNKITISLYSENLQEIKQQHKKSV